MSKNHKNRSKNIKTEEIKNNIPLFLKSNYIIYAILFIIMALAFYIRAIIPWNAAFANGITVFATDDAVYHMRLVENLIANFPHRLTYDAFTLYPYGSVLTWGYFYDFIIGTLALIFGVNNLNVIGALVPAIMGTLVVIPVYFIGAELLNKKAGLISAFIIAILPGSFLQRSTLGFTDHHVAEVLFTTFFMMYLIFAFNRIKDIFVEDLYRKNLIKLLKSPLKYAILAGIFLGFYILTWTTGILFAGIAAVFIVLQIFINYATNKSNSTLITITTVVYGISALMVLPVVDIRNGFGIVFYSPTHIILLISVILVSMYLNSLSIRAKKNNIGILVFIGMTLISFIGLIVIISTILPSFYFSTFGSLDVLFGAKSGGGLTIGEAQPTDLITIYGMFGLNTIFAVIGGLFLILTYYLIENKEKILIAFIWCALILILLFSQNRWAYYFAVNIAILSGLLCGYVLDYIGKWKDIKNINVWNIVSLITVIFIIGFYPLGSSPYTISIQTTVNGVRSGGFYEWHDALTWMRNNTPDTGLDYYGTYERPESGQMYPYPSKAYGVMSWWDYGHIITYWGHRIPDANPFQSGIGGTANHIPGASTFLIAQTENDADKVLDALKTNESLGTKYIVSNAYMAYAIQPVFAEWDGTNVGYFQQVQTSQGVQILPSTKYYSTMESKLHILDANGLQHYRLIHESTINQNTDGGAQELVYKQIYNALINPKNPVPVELSGYVKIFEVVKGATIAGRTTPNTVITIENNIITNINRNIHYKQTIISDSEGNFNFTVPYSTTGTISGETQFDTKATEKYILTANNIKVSVDVNEEEVLNGRTVNV
jgi:oligosaccharyl transferase (archaeosortase A-associated)